MALYVEHSLNQKSKQIPVTERFHQRMINVNPSSLSKIAFNVQPNADTPWNYFGGTGPSVDRIFRDYHIVNGVDSSCLGRWTWIRLEGRLNTFASYIMAYQPCRKKKRFSNNLEPTCKVFQQQGNIISKSKGRFR